MEYMVPRAREAVSKRRLYPRRVQTLVRAASRFGQQNALRKAIFRPHHRHKDRTLNEQHATSQAQNDALFNRLHLTDALPFARALPAASIDMLLTDPPYSSGGLHSGSRRQDTTAKYIQGTTKAVYEDFEFDNMDQRAWSFWCHAWLSAARVALKPGGLVVCFIDWRQLPALTDVIQAAGFTLQGLAVWDKTVGRSRPRNGGFKQQAEFIVWASKGKLPARGVYLAGVFQARLELPKKHLTEKPMDIAREIVRLVPPGGAVADFFAGCGTFLLAAKEAGLTWTGCELKPAIHARAAARLAA